MSLRISFLHDFQQLLILITSLGAKIWSHQVSQLTCAHIVQLFAFDSRVNTSCPLTNLFSASPSPAFHRSFRCSRWQRNGFVGLMSMREQHLAEVPQNQQFNSNTGFAFASFFARIFAVLDRRFILVAIKRSKSSDLIVRRGFRAMRNIGKLLAARNLNTRHQGRLGRNRIQNSSGRCGWRRTPVLHPLVHHALRNQYRRISRSVYLSRSRSPSDVRNVYSAKGEIATSITFGRINSRCRKGILPRRLIDSISI